MRQSKDILIKKVTDGTAYVKELESPWKGYRFRCEGFLDLPGGKSMYANAIGHTAYEAERNWRAKACRESAIENQQDAEALIYKHNRRKYDK